MVNRTIYNLKTLQIQPTNRLYLKGLLTYRTIQFSMSSGCCHPKNSFCSARLDQPSARPCPSHRLLSPIRGTKNPSADLIILNSASQTSVNSQPFYSRLRRLSKTFFLFVCRGCASQLDSIYPYQSGCQKLFLLFFAAEISDSQRTRAENILSQNLRKYFFNFFLACLHSLRPQRISPRKPTGNTGTRPSNSARMRGLEADDSSSLPADIRTTLMALIPARCRARTVRGYG